MATTHPGLTSEAIAQAGANIGLAKLSLGSLARVLGVSTPALYRHISSRRYLEQLVAAKILASPSLARTDPSARTYLFALAHPLFDLCQAYAGLAQYLFVDFPADAARRSLG